MADEFLVKYLLKSLGQPGGRTKWLDRKTRSRHIDLASVDLTSQAMANYDFSEVNFSAAILLECDLTGCDFSDAQMSFADLRRASLSRTVLDRANLESANLQEADLSDACLERVNLAKAQLEGADLIGADLSSADLSGAVLRGASLKYARLVGARLQGADVAHADLTGSVMDDEALGQLVNFDRAIVDDRKYREMKSHISISTSTDVATVESKEIAPAARTDIEKKKAEKPPKKWKDKKDKEKRRKRWWAFLDEIDEATASGAAADPALTGHANGYVPSAEDLKSEDGWRRILGLERGATLTGITKAFRRMAKRYHPDMVLDLTIEEQERARELFQIVRRAYEMLTSLKAKPLTHIAWAEGVPMRESPYAYSIEEYLLLARANPSNTAVLFNLAWKFFEQNMLQEALDAYERVLTINPDDIDAAYNLRVVYLYKEFDLDPDLG